MFNILKLLNVLCLFFIVFLVCLSVDVSNMPCKDIEKDLFLKNQYRNDKVYNKEKKETNIKNIDKRQNKKILEEKTIKKHVKKNKINEEVTFITERLIFDYANYFSLEEIKLLHKKIELILKIKNIRIIIITYSNKDRLNIEKSFIKKYSKIDNLFLLCRNETNFDIYCNSKNSIAFQIQNILNNFKMGKSKNYFDEMDKILDEVYENLKTKNITKNIDKKDKNSLKKEKPYLFFIIMVLLVISYIFIDTLLKYLENK